MKKKNINIFKCQNCNDGNEIEFKDFRNHLSEVHGINPDKCKATRQMLMHMDGATFYQSQYKWTFESGLVAIQHCYNTRSKNDPIRY